MAKKSSIEKNNRRKAKADKLGLYRRELRKQSLDTNRSDDERDEAFLKLQKLPRDTSMSRVVNRCVVTGRAKGVLKGFGFSRIIFRELALSGKLPGVTKSSW